MSRINANAGNFENKSVDFQSPRESFAMAISRDGQSLYTLAVFYNEVHIFARNTVSGVLSFVSSLFDKKNPG